MVPPKGCFCVNSFPAVSHCQSCILFCSFIDRAILAASITLRYRLVSSAVVSFPPCPSLIIFPSAYYFWLQGVGSSFSQSLCNIQDAINKSFVDYIESVIIFLYPSLSPATTWSKCVHLSNKNGNTFFLIIILQHKLLRTILWQMGPTVCKGM